MAAPAHTSPLQITLSPDDGGGPVESDGCRQVSTAWTVDLDPAVLVDAMTNAWLRHTREAILTGQRPDGGGPQKPLSARALADPDRESPHRGYKTGELADGLRRSAISSSGATATATCYPPISRNAYVGKEAKRGVNLITGAGAAGEAALRAAREVGAAMAEGRAPPADRREHGPAEAAK